MSITTGEPTHNDLLNIAALCELILAMTGSPEHAGQWRTERNGARRILKRTQSFGYFQGKDAPWDYDWLVDTLTTLEEELSPSDVTVTLAELENLFTERTA